MNNRLMYSIFFALIISFNRNSQLLSRFMADCPLFFASALVSFYSALSSKFQALSRRQKTINSKRETEKKNIVFSRLAFGR